MGFPAGAELLTALYTLLQHADEATLPLARYLFVAALRPYWAAARRWLSTGDVHDPHGELFHVDGTDEQLRLPSFLQPVEFELLQCGLQVRSTPPSSPCVGVRVGAG